MLRADELIPWKVTDISLRPFKGMWSFNPSIHYDGRLWRCVLRCSDYAMPGGTTIRSNKAKPGQTHTKSAMVILDPDGWHATEIYKMREEDGLPRATSGSLGYEDMRIFRTDRHGLQGIAAALHLRRTDRRKPIPEQVLLSFDDEYTIVEATPIRGAWSDTPQKNWVPFDNCVEPRFLYAIDKGVLFDDRGELSAADAQVQPSSRPRRSRDPSPSAVAHARDRAEDAFDDQLRDDREDRRKHRDTSARERSTPAADPAPGYAGYEGLRGGTQLVRVDDDKWLGLGHSMKFIDGLKYYWHVWYLVDSCGKIGSASAPMKLVPNGIEFAAGIAVEGERVVVSFGVDDMECRLGETKLSAVLEILLPTG